MKKILTSLFALLSLASVSASAALLPPLENVFIDGNQLVWDAQEGATGYNVYKDYQYHDTVKDGEQYSLSDSGLYYVVAFDDQGNFGAQYGDFLEYVAGEGEGGQFSFEGHTIIVQKTCLNVGPGESCLASCPYSYETGYSTVYTKYMSGGACATSDIVEADAFVSGSGYKCTVPTYSGEVVAQAICVIF